MLKAPISMEDLGALRDRIKQMPWSIVPSVDATLKGDVVSLEMRLGTAVLMKSWKTL